MYIFKNEFKRSKLSLIIWSAVLVSLLAMTVLIFPLMKLTMEQMEDMLSGMGELSEAYGMNQVSLTDYTGYFCLECSEILGLGGGLFAAITGIAIISKEERDKTAEFLLTHPVSRTRVLIEKLLALIAQLLVINVAAYAVTLFCTLAIGENFDIKIMTVLFCAYLMLQLEIGFITFGISSFIKGKGIGIGLGTALLFYFLNLASNITDKVEFLKYVTPFGYADATYIVSNASIEFKYLAVGAVLAAAGIVTAFIKYQKKDL